MKKPALMTVFLTAMLILLGLSHCATYVGTCERKVSGLTICDEYYGDYSEASAKQECATFGGSFTTDSCPDKDVGEAGRCFVQTDGKKEKIQIVYDFGNSIEIGEAACLAGGSRFEREYGELDI